MTAKGQVAAIALSEKAKRACDLRNEGWSLEEIAAELGYRTRSGVMKLIDKRVQALPVESATTLRERLNARYDKVHRSLGGIIGQTKKEAVRVRALEAQSRNAQRQARLNHLEQEAPIILAPTINVRVDLSRLSPEELETYHRLRQRVQVVEEPVVVEAKAMPPTAEGTR